MWSFKSCSTSYLYINRSLIAQGRTVAETLEIARDVARKLLEAQSQDESSVIQ
jgi:hypothetical protein